MSTIDESTLRDQYAPYIEAWRKRWQAEHERQRKRAKAARLLAATCAQLLVDGYGVTRVWLIGSVLKPETFRKGSDIDLAVEGLADRDYFPALAKLYEQLPAGLELDLISVETAQASLREHVMEEGELLYERT